MTHQDLPNYIFLFASDSDESQKHNVNHSFINVLYLLNGVQAQGGVVVVLASDLLNLDLLTN